MNKNEHLASITPQSTGWRVTRSTHPVYKFETIEITDSNNVHVATITGECETPIDEKHAKMIAAVPKLLSTLAALLKHSEGTNLAFYGKGTAKAMKEAMNGQKELLQAARAAIADAS